MPLRDHTHRPDARRPNWHRVHGGWPMVLVQHLVPILPPGYTAGPHVHIGVPEVDVGTHEQDEPGSSGSQGNGGTATRAWAPPVPTLRFDADPPDVDEYAVRVYDEAEGERLVASVEFVSPANKDRPEKRRMFVAKCAALLDQGVCVSVVDCVTAHRFNLYADLLDFLGHADPSMGTPAHPIYAVTIRRTAAERRWQLETWAHPLRVGQQFPAIPLWFNAMDGTMLPLEETYEETCRTLSVRD